MLDTSIALMNNYQTIVSRLPPYIPENLEKQSDDVNESTQASSKSKSSINDPGPSTSKINEPSTSNPTLVNDTLEQTIPSGPNDEIRRRRLRHFENNQ